MAKRGSESASIAVNRKARHLYEFLETLEAGIALLGPEIKSLRGGKVSFKDAFVFFRNGEAWLCGLYIAPYENAGYAQPAAERDRKLLLHASEIRNLAGRVEQKGLALVPWRLYFRNGRVKVEIALGKGRKLYDQRDELKRRAEDRDARREMDRRG